MPTMREPALSRDETVVFLSCSHSKRQEVRSFCVTSTRTCLQNRHADAHAKSLCTVTFMLSCKYIYLHFLDAENACACFDMGGGLMWQAADQRQMSCGKRVALMFPLAYSKVKRAQLCG